ncbi:MAG TPA: patatin-like phospholipase family protein [Xanthobacteraceae bacterium]|jgi:NTE family protein|nr:patatin-like phospholipase family protein [Xanthobacteraceae bacterium]
MRWYSVFVVAVLSAAAGCGSVHNTPQNVPLSGEGLVQSEPNRANFALDDDMLVTLSFSGGGTRAAAFSYGALRAFNETSVPARAGGGVMIDRVDFVSGVSGGSVPAAYFGLKKRAMLDDFQENFLLRNPEEALNTQVNLANLGRGLSGGVNQDTQLSGWLNQHLFKGATFKDLRNGRPRVWINSSDIYNRTPFVFGHTAFDALCSNLDEFPVADAVAASSAVPVAFAPIVIESYGEKCTRPLPSKVIRAVKDTNANPMLRSFAQALMRYRDGSMKYVKLLDGGLVDNYGLSGFTIARLAADRPYEPMTPHEAVKIRRAMFLLVDAGRAPTDSKWVSQLEGPSGAELVAATSDTALDASVRASYTAFQQVTSDWQRQLIGWRCSLPPAERKRLGIKPGWNCRDVKFFVGRVDFGQFDSERAAALNAIKTRFTLPAEQVELLIQSGNEAVRSSPTFRAFLGSL